MGSWQGRDTSTGTGMGTGMSTGTGTRTITFQLLHQISDHCVMILDSGRTSNRAIGTGQMLVALNFTPTMCDRDRGEAELYDWGDGATIRSSESVDDVVRAKKK